MDNDPEHTAKANQDFIKAKKWNIPSLQRNMDFSYSFVTTPNSLGTYFNEIKISSS